MLFAFARLVRERPAGRPTVLMASTVNEENGFSGVESAVPDVGSTGHAGDSASRRGCNLRTDRTVGRRGPQGSGAVATAHSRSCGARLAAQPGRECHLSARAGAVGARSLCARDRAAVGPASAVRATDVECRHGARWTEREHGSRSSDDRNRSPRAAGRRSSGGLPARGRLSGTIAGRAQVDRARPTLHEDHRTGRSRQWTAGPEPAGDGAGSRRPGRKNRRALRHQRRRDQRGPEFLRSFLDPARSPKPTPPTNGWRSISSSSPPKSTTALRRKATGSRLQARGRQRCHAYRPLASVRTRRDQGFASGVAHAQPQVSSLTPRASLKLIENEVVARVIELPFGQHVVPGFVVDRRPHFLRIAEVQVVGAFVVLRRIEILRVVDVGIVIEPVPVLGIVVAAPSLAVGVVGLSFGLANSVVANPVAQSSAKTLARIMNVPPLRETKRSAGAESFPPAGTMREPPKAAAWSGFFEISAGQCGIDPPPSPLIYPSATPTAVIEGIFVTTGRIGRGGYRLEA